MTSGESRAVTNLSEYRDRAAVAGAAHALRQSESAPRPLPTGTVTFLLTDIEDSTPRRSTRPGTRWPTTSTS